MGDIWWHPNAIKLFLKEDNMRQQLAILFINSIPDDLNFNEMYNIIHIDKKWFYMTI